MKPPAAPPTGVVVLRVRTGIIMEQIQAVQQVDRYVDQRRFTDQKFVSWALYFFLLSWVTLGIYAILIFYRRIDRADRFGDRRVHYYNAVIAASGQYAES
ncbi:DUF4234 domain-containing protein [Streptomyces sp. HC44]|uniref:DUF4234 domain-containing protein n=1 Tax=Streptomyces scabichelini TaxID=2711217 RepID=A0A6G4V4G5_9ACTN|nr:DUF4234 domain-containing protein [Streptomyces scabichelini]NGO08734.1 DUF4234 domain-containing protein [Streptomyces scabichelini]